MLSICVTNVVVFCLIKLYACKLLYKKGKGIHFNQWIMDWKYNSWIFTQLFMHNKKYVCFQLLDLSYFLVPQIEYPLGGSIRKGSHGYFLLQVFCVVLLFDINVVQMLPWWPDVTIIQSDVTIIVPWQLSTGNKHDYLFCYCPLVGILFEVLRIKIAWP